MGAQAGSLVSTGALLVPPAFDSIKARASVLRRRLRHCRKVPIYQRVIGSAVKSLDLNKLALRVTLTATVVVFWTVRAYYWSHVDEKPFSDLLDYVTIGRNIYEHFFWGKSEEYATYFTPVTPAVIASSLLIGGYAHYELVFRILVQCVALVGGLLLAYEIAKASGRPLLGMGLLVIVALCRASIFWSYKLGTETVSEALLLITAAFALRTIRTGAWPTALLCGTAGLTLALNRPQFFPAIFLVGLIIATHSVLEAPEPKSSLRPLAVRFALPAAAFCIGAALIWVPWVVRNYAISHELILVGTSSAESFLWETGGASIGKTPYSSLALSDGSVVTEFGLPALRRRVAHLPTDAKRNRELKLVVDAWLRENWREMPSLMARRLMTLSTMTGASGLTTVSRERLFGDGQDSPLSARLLDRLLFDKSALTTALTVIGAIIAIFILHGAGLVLGILAIVPVFVASFVIGIERAVESLISLQLWLSFFSMYSVAEFTLRTFRRYFTLNGH